jgi:uncharacterized membrane protein YdfJ with MMPL/SSD domain
MRKISGNLKATAVHCLRVVLERPQTLKATAMAVDEKTVALLEAIERDLAVEHFGDAGNEDDRSAAFNELAAADVEDFVSVYEGNDDARTPTP